MKKLGQILWLMNLKIKSLIVIQKKIFKNSEGDLNLRVASCKTGIFSFR